MTDSSEGAFLSTHLFPVSPQHIYPWPPAHPVLHNRGVWGGAGPVHFTPGGQPLPKSRTFLEEKKWGFRISPRSSSVQPDVSDVNVLFCLFILVDYLSTLLTTKAPPQSFPGFQPLRATGMGSLAFSYPSVIFLFAVAPAGCVAF